jgi:ribosomal protein S12 methylthiotransferase accessory factor
MAGGPSAKTFWRGTHRTREPAETLARFGRFASALGITRIANVTGLDYLGIPVFMAVRPNARSLSVAQGKGLDENSAAASAFMEAAEIAHAEETSLRRRVATYEQLKSRGSAVDPAALPRLKGAPAPRDCVLEWVEGLELNSGRNIFVPHDLVHTRYDRRRRRSAQPFHCTSNGLASGNHWLEAVVAGLCETIERDATGLWRHRAPREQAARRLVLGGVRQRDCRALLDRLAGNGMNVAVWDVTTDIGVAAFLCRIVENEDNERANAHGPFWGPFWGAGCHLSREVALARAITEAAQSRLTAIVGSRDDLSVLDYDRSARHGLYASLTDAWERQHATRKFSDVPSDAAATFEADLSTILARLRAAGLAQAVAVDLTDARFGIPVVRIVVPGLEVECRHGRNAPGRRARALVRQRQ